MEKGFQKRVNTLMERRDKEKKKKRGKRDFRKE